MNDIDKLDGMVKIKKCGYEIIGGCKELRKYKQALEEIREIAKCRIENLVILEKCNEVLNEQK